MSAAPATAAYPIPDLAQVKDLLGMLFDGLSVKLGPKLDVAPKANSYFGVYVSDDGSPAALCGCDLAFAANSGAALSLLPPNAAKEAMKDKELTPVMLANLHEVMNICTRLMLRDGSPHLKLRELCALGALPPPAAAIIGAPRNRVDFEIGIGKYGVGVLAVMCL
jgi:hypothetical protein